MPTTPHHYEDAVLKGTALVLLDLPLQLQNAVLPLRKLLDEYHPHNGITHMLLNDRPALSTSDEGVMEYGAVFFKSAMATWALLDKVEVVLRTEDGPLELRRGYLKLGDQKILVEGVVTWGAEGRDRRLFPSSQQQQRSEEQLQQLTQSSHSATASPTQQSLPPFSQGAETAAARNTDDAKEHDVHTVVVSMHFKEVYNRHRNVREEQRRIARGDLPSMFPLTPFMVYQMLLSECQPRKIVLIDSRRTTQQRLMKALVEVENAEVAAHVVHVFTHRAVEYVSESLGARKPERLCGRNTREKIDPKPICAEVRYYVNSYYSTPNGQSRYHPNGERNYHRSIVVRHQERDSMSLVDPRDAAAVAVRAPREWQHDAHANRLASVAEADSPDREEPSIAGEHENRSVPPSKHPYPSARHAAERRDERLDRRRRSSPGRWGRGGRRSRSHSLKSRSSSLSTSRSPSRSGRSSRSSSMSSRSSRARDHWRRPRREDRRRRDDVRRSHCNSGGARHDRSGGLERGADRYEEHKATTSLSSAMFPRFESVPATTVISDTAGPVEHKEERLVVHRQQPQQNESPRLASAAAVAQAFQAHPPQPLVQGNGLPPGWRPIFSEEYKQTYYAYRDPLTGVETTTWERPRG